MGLDMYMFRCRKINEAERAKFVGQNVQDVSENGDYLYFSKREFMQNKTNIELFPVLTNVKMKNTFIDIEKIRKDNSIPNNAIISGSSYSSYSSDSTSYTFTDFKEFRKSVTISDAEMTDKGYLFDEEDEYLICHTEEVAYWRKAEDIRNIIHNATDSVIENCGYYEVSKELIDQLNDMGELNKDELYCEDDEMIFYHEWY